MQAEHCGGASGIPLRRAHCRVYSQQHDPQQVTPRSCGYAFPSHIAYRSHSLRLQILQDNVCVLLCICSGFNIRKPLSQLGNPGRVQTRVSSSPSEHHPQTCTILPYEKTSWLSIIYFFFSARNPSINQKEEKRNPKTPFN